MVKQFTCTKQLCMSAVTYTTCIDHRDMWWSMPMVCKLHIIITYFFIKLFKPISTQL